jgi:thioredoxin-like negative regulator of GroEL
MAMASLWPVTLQAARDRSAHLVTAGDKAKGPEAANDYLLATYLDPANHTAHIRLARTQIAAGQADLALVTLERAGQGSEVEQLKVRTLIEIGRPTDASNEASRLIEPGRTEDDIVLAALAFGLAGRTADAQGLSARVTSPEAAGRIVRALAAPITLAAELYATGLQNSSSALLQKLPVSYERNYLLARINYGLYTKASLAKAAELLQVSVELNPASLEARELLAKVYRAQGEENAAIEQDAASGKLRSGRP